MSTITVPVSSHDHVPNLPELEKRELNWLGRIIHWVNSTHSKGVFVWALVHTITLLVAIALCLSIVGIPLVILGVKESVRQDERGRFDYYYENLLKLGTEHSKDRFLNGRLGPLDGMNISLKSATRKKILHDLDIKEKDAKYKKDIDLLRMAAAKYADFIVRYNLQISG